MDNVDENTGIKLYELTELLHSARMYPRKWLSNSIEVLKVIPETDLAEHHFRFWRVTISKGTWNCLECKAGFIQLQSRCTPRKCNL